VRAHTQSGQYLGSGVAYLRVKWIIGDFIEGSSKKLPLNLDWGAIVPVHLNKFHITNWESRLSVVYIQH